MNKASFKKILGTIGCITFYFICIYAIIKDTSLTVAVLVNLGALIIALFGLKKWNGTFKTTTNNQQEQ